MWAAAQKVLREMLNQDIYNLWFANLRPTGLNGDEITLEVPNDFCEVWLKENYLSLLQDVISHCTGRSFRVKLVVPTVPFQCDNTPASPVPENGAASISRPVATASPARASSIPRARSTRSWWAPTTISPTRRRSPSLRRPASPTTRSLCTVAIRPRQDPPPARHRPVRHPAP